MPRNKPRPPAALVIIGTMAGEPFARGSTNHDIARRIHRQSAAARSAGYSVHYHDGTTTAIPHSFARIADTSSKSVFLCGFNLNEEILHFALEARKNGFSVTVLSDLTGNGTSFRQSDVPDTVAQLAAAGVAIQDSTGIFAPSKKPPAPRQSPEDSR